MWVQVSLEEWSSLQEDSRTLSALRAAGVDNWEGYDTAMLELAAEEQAQEEGLE